MIIYFYERIDLEIFAHDISGVQPKLGQSPFEKFFPYRG